MNKKQYVAAPINNELIKRQGDILHNHTVPIVGYEIQSANRTYLQQIGSGVLVTAGNVSGILTAQHVSAQIQNYEGIALPLSKSVQRFFIKNSHLSILEEPNPSQEEMGPDLAVIYLGAEEIGTIKANKVFLNLELQKIFLDEHQPKIHEGLWYVCGAPSDHSSIREGNDIYEFIHSFNTYSFQVTTAKHCQKSSFEYLDVMYKYDEYKNPPDSFGGISGGGLWHVLVGFGMDGNIVTERLLAGIVYYQSKKERNTRLIRANFNNTIFEHFYDKAFSGSRK